MPSCEACGGVLKPAVVFFGGSIPAAVVERAKAMVDAADALLVVGSSLEVRYIYIYIYILYINIYIYILINKLIN